MSNKKTSKQLVLAKQTVRHLGAARLMMARGGASARLCGEGTTIHIDDTWNCGVPYTKDGASSCNANSCNCQDA